MSKVILGLVGKIASGKDECKKYLENNHGASSHRFSTMLRDVLNRLYLPVTRENLQDISLDLRKRFGADTLARVIAQDVSLDKNDIVIVEGIRRLADIKELQNFPNFHLISIDADQKTRYDRVVKRNENSGDAEKTFAQFAAEEQHETEHEIPIVMSQARFQVDNNGSLEELHQQLQKIIEKLWTASREN